MHKKRNRLIAALLTFAMCLGVISPLSAFADGDASGSTTTTVKDYSTDVETVFANPTDGQTGTTFLSTADSNGLTISSTTLDAVVTAITTNNEKTDGAEDKKTIPFTVTKQGTTAIITLTEDATIGRPLIIATTAILDLNGHELAGLEATDDDDAAYAVIVRGEGTQLLVRDSKANGANGKITGALGILVESNASLTMQGVTISVESNGDVDEPIARGLSVEEHATATITDNGAVKTSITANGSYSRAISAEGTVTMTGGEVSSNWLDIVLVGSSKLTLDGTHITGSDGTYGVYAATESNATVKLTNVTIDGDAGEADDVYLGVYVLGNSTVTIEKSTIDAYYGVYTEDSANVTLDNVTIGKKTTDGDTETYTSTIGVGANHASVVTIKNSSITASSCGAYASGTITTYDSSGNVTSTTQPETPTKLTIENTSIVSAKTAVEVDQYAECIVNGAETSISGTTGILLWGYTTTETTNNSGWDKKGPKLTVNDGTIESQTFAICGNGSHDYTNITINGGTIESEGAAGIFHPQIGDLTITGGSITGEESGVQFTGAGNLTITGGTITGTYEYTEFPTKTISQGDGSVNDGAAVSIILRGSGYQDNENQKITVKITDGAVLNSEHNAALLTYFYGKNSADTEWTSILSDIASSKKIIQKLISLEITGGEFNANTKAAAGDKTKEALEIAADTIADNGLKVTGGTFSTDPSETLKTGVYAGTYNAVKDNGKYTVQLTGAVKLTEDKSVANFDAPNNQYDLQGKTLTYTGSAAITGNVTITDTSTGTKGTLKLNNITASIAPASGNTVILDNITVDGANQETALDATNGTIKISGTTTVNGALKGKNFEIADGATFSQDPSDVLAKDQCAVLIDDSYVVYKQIKLEWDTQPTITKSKDYTNETAVKVDGVPSVKLASSENLTEGSEQANAATTYVNELNALLQSYTEWDALFTSTNKEDETVNIFPKDATDAADFKFNTWLTSAISKYGEEHNTETTNIDALKYAARFPISEEPTAAVSFTTTPNITYQGKTVNEISLTTGQSATLIVSKNTDYSADTNVTWSLEQVDDYTAANVATIDNGKITAVGAGKVNVVATIGAAGATQTKQSVTLTVGAADLILSVQPANGSETATIDGIPTKAKIESAFDLVAMDSTGATVEGDWSFDIDEDTNSATVKFTPTDTTKHNEKTLEDKITWESNIVELKLVVASNSNDGKLGEKNDGIYTATLEFALADGVTYESFSNDDTTLNNILSSFTSWKVSAKGYLYPVKQDGTTVDTKLADNETAITTPQLFVKYVNEQLASGTYKLTAALNEDENATTTGSDYVLKADSLSDTVLSSIKTEDQKTITDFLTEKLNKLATSDGSEGGTTQTVSGADGIDKAMQDIIKGSLDFTTTTTSEVTNPGEVAGEDSEPQTEEIQILASATYDVTYTDENGKAKYNDFAGGSLRVELDIPVEEQATAETDNADDANEESYYLVAHLVMHEDGKDPYIEYLKPEVDVDKGKLVVNVKSLSLFTALKTNAEVQGVPYANVEETPADDTTDDKKTDSASVAPAAKADDSGAIILAGAVVATVVVGGIIYYNWDKLPVHKIEGTVVDANGAAIANATVTLAKDGKVVKTITTDANGYYSAKVAKGDYTITVTVGEASATAEGSTGASAQLAIA